MEHCDDRIFNHHQESENNEFIDEQLPRGPQTAEERALFRGLGRSTIVGRYKSGVPITERAIQMQRIMGKGKEG